MVARLCDFDRTPDGVECRIVAIGKNLAVEFVGARLGEDFNSSITESVVLRRKRILVDANFANRRLGWNLTAGETIDINLSAVRPGRRSGKRLQFRLQFIRIVG